MDLLDFTAEDLYFDEPGQSGIDDLLARAAEDYGHERSELLLLQAYFLQPQNLTVLVGMYRYYFYQHRYPEALTTAERAMQSVAERLGVRADWRQLDANDLAIGVQKSMVLMRFYLYALKGAGYLKLRMGQLDDALVCLNKVAELDSSDRIGVKGLIELVERTRAEEAEEAVAAAG